jgi:hypothetical protein
MRRRAVLAGRRVARSARAVAALPAEQLVLRAVIGVAGGLALLIAPAGQLVGAGLIALLAVPALAAAVLRPDGAGPAGVLGAAIGAWAVRYGVTAAPLATAFVLSALLYVHHLTAALCAAVPPAAAIDREVLLRWAVHAAGVLALTGAAAGGLGLLGRPAPSAPLELLGIGAAVALAALLVLLARSGRQAPAG